MAQSTENTCFFFFFFKYAQQHTNTILQITNHELLIRHVLYDIHREIPPNKVTIKYESHLIDAVYTHSVNARGTIDILFVIYFLVFVSLSWPWSTHSHLYTVRRLKMICSYHINSSTSKMFCHSNNNNNKFFNVKMSKIG